MVTICRAKDGANQQARAQALTKAFEVPSRPLEFWTWDDPWRESDAEQPKRAGRNRRGKFSPSGGCAVELYSSGTQIEEAPATARL